MAYKRSFSNAYEGAAASFSSSYYLRNFYVSNRDAQTAIKRADFETDTLSLSDSMALRRAVRQLGSFSYGEEQNENIRNSVLAYISTYNNALSSVSSQAAEDDEGMKRLAKQLKTMTAAHADELDKIGITVNKDGTLKSRDGLFKTADLSKFKSLFSRDSDYMQRVSACAKRIQTRSDSLIALRYQRAARAAEKNTNAGTPAAPGTTTPSGSQPDPTAAAQIVAQSLDLDTLCNTGIGANVNVSL